ncbi:MAG: hypothetical protein ABIJ20_00980 [Nanoarchaeota archaeon]|nr:hypothetical protein [Nanoarchaeota archaeon]MBU1444729.1 hypothetical protein [Nanoarchaeota archaeon]MBU2406866.1 hypothetical protein [Nanoarchaeota archaeon]MBU2420775.1 hypothetical protein [Nanoarchaeota archaeon]MBU2475373.1 hypothetical protein [Nanoarchaeota archaeon]
MRGVQQVEGEDVAVLVWGIENGVDYGYDTCFLVWRNTNGDLSHRFITDSSANKGYLSADITADNDNILVSVKGKEFRIKRESLS